MRRLTFPQFVALESRPQINEALEFADGIGCVLNYVPFALDSAPDEIFQCQKTLEAMALVVKFYEHRAETLNSAQYPIEQFWRVHFDSEKLKGEPINSAQFWGNDDAFPKAMGENCYSIPLIDGYKTAFFNPPHNLGLSRDKQIELFDQINSQLWNGDLSDCSITNWSTDWSNYFDAGHEWWGAFWWTVYSPQTQLLTVIGASTTD